MYTGHIPRQNVSSATKLASFSLMQESRTSAEYPLGATYLV